MTRAEKIFLDAQRYFKEESYEKAFELHLRSAELGYAPAQSNVGYAYLHGKGTQQDYTQAVAWFEKAAAQNNTPAMINLGYCYTKGFGVTADKEEAMYHFGRAAMLGSEQAQKLYDRMQVELGIAAPALVQEEAEPVPEAPVTEPIPDAAEASEAVAEEPAEKEAPFHYEDAKQRVRKLIGADFRWALLALAVTAVSFALTQLLAGLIPELVYILLWLVTLAGFFVASAGLSAVPGFRNAKKCLDRLEKLGLLDLAVEEIQFGDPQPFGFSGCITESFIYGNGAIFAIEDILWVYPKAEKKLKALKVVSKTLPPMTLSGAARIDRTGMMDKTIAQLLARNPKILSGNTPENKKAYEQLRG